MLNPVPNSVVVLSAEERAHLTHHVEAEVDAAVARRLHSFYPRIACPTCGSDLPRHRGRCRARARVEPKSKLKV